MIKSIDATFKKASLVYTRCTVKFSVSIRFNRAINRWKTTYWLEETWKQKFRNKFKETEHTHTAFRLALTRTYDAFSMYLTQLHTINQTSVIKLSKIHFFSSRTKHDSRDPLKRAQFLNAALGVYVFISWVFFSSYHFRRTLELISLIASFCCFFSSKKGS